MQDAFTKTVPIWCAVLNRAVRNVRQQSQLGRHADDGVPHGTPTSEAIQWDADLHLPRWVSESEANHISTKLDGWTKTLLQVCWSKTSSYCFSGMLTSLRQSRALSRIFCSQHASEPGIWAITAAMTAMSTYLVQCFGSFDSVSILRRNSQAFAAGTLTAYGCITCHQCMYQGCIEGVLRIAHQCAQT